MDILNSLIKDVSSLPSLPAIAVRIIQEVKRDKFSLGKLADIISVDPALTAKVLKLANSSFYALPYKIDSIEKAVNILGIEALKSAALTFVIVTGLKRNSIDGFDHEFFWKRSLTAAVSAEIIASKLQINHHDTFVTPLLMDIGVLVIYLSRPDDYLRVLHEKRISKVTITEAERSVFGFDHQDVGSEILNSWGLPEDIYIPIAYHHWRQDYPSELSNIVDILMLSDLASSVYHSSKSIEKLVELNHLLQNRLNITETDANKLIDSVAEKTVEILSFYEIDAGDMKPYSEILQDANKELGKLNLSYEQLVLELKQAKKKSEDLVVELWDAKEKMKEIAIRDVLTGLYNHRYFHELMDYEISRIERYQRVLSLIMLDIDYFKNVNDSYGHLQGDEVLRTIGNVLSQSVRTSDVATRYGGEEFTIVLPETDTNGAVTVAERIRQMIEELEIRNRGHIIKVTVSIGITTYEPFSGIKSKSEIINAADEALYNSKMTGRNKLSIVSLYGSS